MLRGMFHYNHAPGVGSSCHHITLVGFSALRSVAQGSSRYRTCVLHYWVFRPSSTPSVVETALHCASLCLGHVLAALRGAVNSNMSSEVLIEDRLAAPE